MVDEKQPTIIPDNFIAMRSAEVQKQSVTIAQTLIQKPRFLPDFLTTLTNYFFSAQAEGDMDEQEKIQSLVKQVERQIGSNQWSSLNDVQLDPEDARGILRSLYTVEHDEKLPNQYKRIIRKIARGYLIERFDPHGENAIPEWEGALLCQQELLHSVVGENLDVEGLNAWFTLMVGENETVMPRDSVGWLAPFIAMRNPVSIPGMEIASEIVPAVELLSSVFNKRDIWQANAVRYSRLNIQLLASRDVIKSEGGIKQSIDRELGIPRVDSALSPNHGRGRQLYKGFFNKENIAKLKEHYGNLDYKAIAMEKVPLEIAALAIMQEMKPEESELIEIALTYLFKTGQEQKGVLGRAVIPHTNGTPIFPFDIFLAEAESLSRIRQLIDPVKIKSAFNEYLNASLAEKGKDWQGFPFTYKTLEGRTLSGYYCAPITGYVTDQMTANLVQQAIHANGKKIEEVDFTTITSEAVSIQVEGGMFVVAKPEFVEKTRLEFMLDQKVSDEKRSSIESIREHIVLSRRIPGNIHLIPTLKGYKYNLRNHQDLSGIIDTVVIKKRKREVGGGMVFSMQLTDDPFTFGSEHPVISGVVSLEADKVNITFDGEAGKLSSDLKVLFENVIMHLIEDLCCPALNEDDHRKPELEGAPHGDIDTPGSIVHIGKRKTKEGSREGKPSKHAAQKFSEDKGMLQRAQIALRGDIGANLSLINDAHQKEHARTGMPDPRLLTYRSGHDLDPDGRPLEKTAPERILGLN